MFNLSIRSYGSEVVNINNKMTLGGNKGLFEFNISNGFFAYAGKIWLDEYYTNNSDFTMFIILKHDSSNLDSVFGFRRELNPQYPFIGININSFYIQKSSTTVTRRTILSIYKNKQLMLWFTKKGTTYKVNLCNNGGLITETLSSVNYFRTDKIQLDLQFHIIRVGFSPKSYDVNGPEFHKILYLEKSKGTFFE